MITAPSSTTTTFLDQIDHVAILSEDPTHLFKIFTETFGLPIFLPIARYPMLTSGSVVLGNMFLDFIRFSQMPTVPIPKPIEAQYYILSFMTQDIPLIDCLGEMAQRGIRHGGVTPFYNPTADAPERLWANVYLGNLFSDTLFTRPFLSMSKRMPDPTMKVSPRTMKFITEQVFPFGLPMLTEFYQINDRQKRSADTAAFQQCRGGYLGIECVQEVILAVQMKEYAKIQANWQRFLAPECPTEHDCWQIGNGPALRIIPGERAGIQSLVLRVSSLEQAKIFLHVRGMVGRVLKDRILVLLPGVRGIDLQLVQG